jgi:kynureninase
MNFGGMKFVVNFSKTYALQLDQQDEIAAYRNEFYIKDGTIYLDGNSLGLLSKRAETTLLEVLESWKHYGIDGWTVGEYPWFYLSERLGHLTAPLVGGLLDEVIVTGSTTVNLHQLVATFYKPKDNKTKILADELTFPSDIYALQSQLRQKGYDPTTHLIRVKSYDGRTLKEDDIIEAMTEEIALIVLPSVLYRSGQILDMKRLARAAHDRNICIGFDLCHSIGSIPHSLHDWNVDFAFWCNYKYLNAGPGSVGGLYVHNTHFNQTPGLSGWFSSNKEVQFDMSHVLTPAEHAGSFQIGTPHILSIAPLIGSLEMFAEVGIEKLRRKSVNLTNYMIELVSSELIDFGFTIANPLEEQKRGGHIYLEHSEAASISKALKANGIIPDFRAPNGIRLAPIAFYNTFLDIYHAITILKKIMEEELYKQYENTRGVIA